MDPYLFRLLETFAGLHLSIFFFKKIKVRDSRYHFSRGKSLSQLDSTFSLHSITVVTLTKLIHFVVMKRSRKEKSSWIKSETKAVANKKKIDEFHPDRRQKLAKSGKGSYFNQLSESEAAFASCLDVSAASKKKTWERRKQKKTMLRESDF